MVGAQQIVSPVHVLLSQWIDLVDPVAASPLEEEEEALLVVPELDDVEVSPEVLEDDWLDPSLRCPESAVSSSSPGDATPFFLTSSNDGKRHPALQPRATAPPKTRTNRRTT